MRRIEWTKEMDDFLIREFSNNTNKDLAEALGISQDSIIRRKKILGLKKEIDKIKEKLSENEKRCSLCKEILTKDKFSKNKSQADGLNQICKQCDKERSAKRRQKKKEEQFLKQKAIEEKAAIKTSTILITCTKCGKEKLGKDFSFIKKTLKRESRCKKCKNEDNKQREIQKIAKGESW